MKANLIIRCSTQLVMLTMAFAVTTSLAVVSLPPSATLQIAPGTNGNVAAVTVSNAGNHVWVLQSSSNLTSWTEVAAIKIHNGSFQRSFVSDAAKPNQFFRAFYDATRQDVFSTTTNALLLPGTPFNYATPVCP